MQFQHSAANVKPTRPCNWRWLVTYLVIFLGTVCPLVAFNTVYLVGEQERPTRDSAESKRGPKMGQADDARPDLCVRINATDSKTKEPIKSLSVTWSSCEPREKHLTWQSQGLKKYVDGPVEFRLARPWPETVLRIEAHGYIPVISRPFKEDEGNVTIDVTMKSDPGLVGKVLMPDGAPADHATVAICTWTNEVTVRGGNLQYIGHGRTLGKLVETAADGLFRTTTEVDPWLLVVAHPSGYAEVMAAEYAKSSVVQLKPWGRIEGRFVVGGQPIANQIIRAGAGRGANDVNLFYSDKATTDAAGKFTVERVPPVQLFVHPLFKYGNSSFNLFGFGGLTTIAAGKTTRIGSFGRAVVGRVSLPPESGLRLADMLIEARIILQPPSLSGDQEDAEQRYAAYAAFMKSDSTKAFQREKIPVESGMFRIEGLPTADYVIQITAQEKSALQGTPSPQNRNQTHAFAAKRVSVPPLSDSQEPVDLGNIVLRLQ